MTKPLTRQRPINSGSLMFQRPARSQFGLTSTLPPCRSPQRYRPASCDPSQPPCLVLAGVYRSRAPSQRVSNVSYSFSRSSFLPFVLSTSAYGPTDLVSPLVQRHGRVTNSFLFIHDNISRRFSFSARLSQPSPSLAGRSYSHCCTTSATMSPIALRTPSTALLALFLTALPSTSLASPISHLNKRDMSTGAKAGLGIGIAVAAVLFLCILTFFIVHIRRSRHLAVLNKERAILAGEKNKDGSDKPDKFVPNPNDKSTMPRRNKSVKDRLMGPLYRGSTIDLMPVPKAHLNGNRDSKATLEGAHWDNVDGQPFLHKPWANGESSPRPSFSSKRATRMMMMM